VNSEVYAAVRNRANGRCELCGKLSSDLELHHVVSGFGRRRQYESVETCLMLCHECHEQAHRDAKLNRALKLLIQERLMRAGRTEEEVRQIMGGRLF